MRRALVYALHLIVAAFAVPWLTLMAAGLAYGILGHVLTSDSTPQRFYSNHLMLLVIIAGALLAYGMSDKFKSRSAEWVWVPFAIGFILRVLYWRVSGSILIGPGSFVEHFFAADCQISNWREGGFGDRCSDKLFLTPLFIGALSYSAGAALHRVIHPGRRSDVQPMDPLGAVPRPPQLVTTRFAAVLVLVLTVGLLGLQLHAAELTRHSSWTWLGSGYFPTWVLVVINTAFWGWLYWLAIALAFGRLPRNEKALLLSFAGNILLIPIGAMLPKINGVVHHIQTFFSLAAFLAAFVILLSFGN